MRHLDNLLVADFLSHLVHSDDTGWPKKVSHYQLVKRLY